MLNRDSNKSQKQELIVKKFVYIYFEMFGWNNVSELMW